jgi:hypothetical protein
LIVCSSGCGSNTFKPLTGMIAYLEAGAGGMAARTAKFYGAP